MGTSFQKQGNYKDIHNKQGSVLSLVSGLKVQNAGQFLKFALNEEETLLTDSLMTRNF